MPMLRAVLLGIALVGGLAYSVQSAPLAGSSAQRGEPVRREATALAFIETGGDLALRERLHKSGSLCHDGGEFLLAQLGGRRVRQLREEGFGVELIERLGEREELFVVLARSDTERAACIKRGARILRVSGDQALVAGPRGPAHRFHNVTAGRAFHGGAVRVRQTPMTAPRPLRLPTGNWQLGVTDPGIQAAVNAVSASNLEQHVVDLSSIFTRCASSSGAITARNQIAAKLQGFGYSTSYQTFSGSYSANVVAELPGTAVPERVVVIGAHYDSIGSSCSGSGPGADDNASGTAGVIEAARVLANAGPFENTIRFILFSAEEFGLIGSNYSSGQSQSAGEDIVAMINSDMSAYRANGDTRDVDFVTNNSTGSLISFCSSVSSLYVGNWASKQGSLSGGTSDHQSYFQDGFPAIFFFEDVSQYSPYIHSSADSYPQSTTDFLLSQMLVRGIVASAATLAEPVDLTLSHTPLVDTQSLGPYEVRCQVGTPGGGNVSTVDLHYAIGSGAFQAVAMTPDGGDWRAFIPGGGSPVTIEYYISATDDLGGSEELPNVTLGAAPFEFFVGQLVVHYFNDFEAGGDQGWTHGQVATQDDWQHDSPNGSAGDASSAFSGSRCWGNDLGISGFNGEYQSNVHNWLRSPTINLSAASTVLLQYRRWLTVEDGQFDQAQIRVNGTVVWQNPTGGGTNHTLDSSWQKHTIDISAQAAGNSSVQVEYRLLSDGGLEFGGWNLDDFSLVSEEGVSCGAESTFCVVSPNSVGAGAQISSNGELGVAANLFQLHVVGVPPNKPGLFFYGAAQTSTPFGEGVRCVDGALFRLDVLVTDVLGIAVDSVDFGGLPPGGDILPGSNWNFQFWFRDPPGGPAGFNVSNALAATFCP
jgi:hypothetical protein